MTLEEKLKAGFGKCQFYSEEEKALYGSKNFNCCEKICKGANRVYNLGLDENAEHITAAFGGGMGIETVCGAVTGSLMAISLKCCDSIEKNTNLKQEYAIPFLKKVEAEMGSIYCHDLKPQYFGEDPTCYCDGAIMGVAKILDETMMEIEKKQKETAEE